MEAPNYESDDDDKVSIKVGSLKMDMVVMRTKMIPMMVIIQGVSKKTLFNEIGTLGGPKTIDRVGDQSKMLSNTLYWSDVPIYPF